MNVGSKERRRPYGGLPDPDVVIEIADWESADARLAHMREAAAAGV